MVIRLLGLFDFFFLRHEYCGNERIHVRKFNLMRLNVGRKSKLSHFISIADEGTPPEFLREGIKELLFQFRQVWLLDQEIAHWLRASAIVAIFSAI